MADAARGSGVGRWIALILVAIGIGALAFAVGRFTMFDAARGGSPAAPATDSADAGFARDMQLHHAQAIDMAMEIHRKTADEELRILAYDIATGQAAQKGEMYDWLVRWGLPQAGEPTMSWMDAESGHGGHGDTAAMTDEEVREAMGMASAEELAALRAASGTEADCLFLALMIRHHQGAIPMAEALIEQGTDARAVEVAQTMKSGQTAEIDAMEAMRLRLGCAA